MKANHGNNKRCTFFLRKGTHLSFTENKMPDAMKNIFRLKDAIKDCTPINPLSPKSTGCEQKQCPKMISNMAMPLYMSISS
jgi:hypothetical protein